MWWSVENETIMIVKMKNTNGNGFEFKPFILNSSCKQIMPARIMIVLKKIHYLKLFIRFLRFFIVLQCFK